MFRPKELPGPIPQPAEPLVAVHQAPARARPSTTVVTAIFPSSSALPENLLKFYLHFSAPMSRGHIYDYLQLRDEVGQPVELPFLEIDEELWNPDMTRLTLFLDPGRIKRGVLPLEEVGPALVEGKRYTLVIDRAWQDGQGNPLREGFTKSFSVGPADRTPPDPDAWRLDPPRAGARTPLALHFDEPLDQALAARILRVVGPGDEFIAGSISLSDAEQRWSFVPDQPWAPGAYQVVIPTHIEDRAGNNIGKPFEVDLVERVERRVTHSAVTRRFDVH